MNGVIDGRGMDRIGMKIAIIITSIVLLALLSSQVVAHCYCSQYQGQMCRNTNCCDAQRECCYAGHVMECNIIDPPPEEVALCEIEITEDHCCPESFEYDKTFRCCMPSAQAVRLVEMYVPTPINLQDSNPPERADPDGCYEGCALVGYCEQKIKETGQKCSWGEGHCRTVDRCSNEILPTDPRYECEGGLLCSQSVNSENDFDSACCTEDEVWTGRDCIPKPLEGNVNEEMITPWIAAWTRTGGNPTGGGILRQTGGGPIFIYTGAGGHIPNITESAGKFQHCPNDDQFCIDLRYTPDFTRERCKSSNGLCYECEAAWPYRIPPSPIWFEARNFGNLYAPAEPFFVCNGPFDGVDGRVKQYRGFTVPAWIECWTGDCNCGRDMDGQQHSANGPTGDEPDAVSSCGSTCATDDPECGSLQSTSCLRGDTGTPEHSCNEKPRGYGFTFNPSPGQAMVDGVPVDPTVVNAQDFVPEACGRIQRKEVVRLIKYTSTYPGDTPENWFDYYITEISESGGSSTATYSDVERPDSENILPDPADPHTVLNDNVLEHTLRQDTRYLAVDVDFTIHHEVWRKPTVKQCTWIGCSRIEEDVVSYHEEVWREEGCAKTWVLHSERDSAPGDEPPCCCTDDNSAPFRGSCTCPYTTIDCNGDDVPETVLRESTKHDCKCQYFCWGCWHFNGESDWYPVSDPGETNTVFEHITDESRVSSRTYGGHLLIENPINRPDSEIQITVDARIHYNISDAPAWGMSHFTIKSVDDETGTLDIFSAVRMEIENVILLEMNAKQFPTLHDMSALQSTLPRDFIVIQDEPERMVHLAQYALPENLLNLSRECRYMDLTNTPPTLEEKEAADPLWIRWTRNPAKKFYHDHDIYTAHATKYTWEYPLFLVDRADPSCLEFIYEKTYNVGLFRTFHEDEPRYYDFTSVYRKPENIEAGIEDTNYDGKLLGNVKEVKLKKEKPVYNVYGRHAIACDHPHYDGVSYTGVPPDMCSDIARLVNNGGTWDCEYKTQYEWEYPILNDTCEGIDTWRVSDIIPCEGIPSKYKSHCVDDMFKALWLDVFQFRYRWNAGQCEIQYIKTCQPKDITPNSYTIIYEPESTLDKGDWDEMEMTVFNNIRTISFDPVGDDDPCTQHYYTLNAGGVQVQTEKIKPQEPYIEGQMQAGTALMDVEVKMKDICTQSDLAVGNPRLVPGVYIDFKYPYTQHTGWYTVGQTITVDVNSGIDLHTEMMIHDDSGFIQSRPVTHVVRVPVEANSWNYLCDNLWILLIAYAVVMAYRFYSGRAADIKDAWDEYKGRK